jgi:lipopolysaccharide/colanic/teichoic acid biosynthesis glycosyltransferase
MSKCPELPTVLLKPHSVRHWIFFADLAWSVVAFAAAEVLRYGAFWTPTARDATFALLPFLAAAAVFWTFLSSGLNLDCFRGGWLLPAVVSKTFLAVLCLMGILFSGAYLRRDYVSRLALSYFAILLFVGFVGIRYLAHLLLLTRYRTGRIRKVAIVGTGRVACELASKINRHPEMLWQVVGFMCREDEDAFSPQTCETAVIVPAPCVADMLTAQEVSDVIVAVPNPSLPDILKLASCCRERGIRVSIVPQPYELYLSRPTLLDLDGIPVLELDETFASNFFLQSKRFVDIVLGSLFSVAAIPILLLPVIRLRLTKGKAFRWETRCGRSGESFAMLRLNVDRHSVDATRFERMLAQMSLTELPQLWNVLRGDMSLVGPRPEPPERVCRYSEWQQQRLRLKPGVTGLAQVQGLREQHPSEDKTHFDLQYLLSCSLWTDLSLLLQTIWTLTVRSASWPKPLGERESAPMPADPVRLSMKEEILEDAHRS